MKENISALIKTRNLKGGHFYFQKVFILHSIATLVGKFHKGFANNIRTVIYKNLAGEAIIKNKLGTFHVNAKDDSFIKSIPTYEKQFHSWLDIPNKKNIFIDCGANIGFYSLLAVNKGYRKVLAFEPFLETYERLSNNVDASRQKNKITTYNFALSNETGQTNLFISKQHTGGNSLKSDRISQEKVVIYRKRLDDILSSENINAKDISFIKIDVEGHELQLLTGLGDTINELASGCLLCIEINDDEAVNQQVRDYLKHNKFSLYKTPSKLSNYLFIKD